jgi:hypothetical protein
MFSLVCWFGLSGGHAALGQPFSQPLNPAVAELLNLCSGGELKASVKNPVCKRWKIDNAGSSGTGNPGVEETHYTSNYKTSCYRGGPNKPFFCFFRQPEAACRAYGKVQGLMVGQTLCPTGNMAINSTEMFRCSFCSVNQVPACTSSGKYIPGEVCGGGTTVFGYLDIVNDISVSFCDTVISGPYSNYDATHAYQVCGTTQTQTYRGMVFTLDQKAQIRAINRAKNGLPSNSQLLKSDMAGYCYPKTGKQPCNETSRGSGICREPEFVKAASGSWDSNQIHHVLPRNDRRGCACGTNSMSNAVVISRSLNRHLSNADRKSLTTMCPGMSTANEVEFVNALPKYIP